jgi:hypothetical protein
MFVATLLGACGTWIGFGVGARVRFVGLMGFAFIVGSAQLTSEVPMGMAFVPSSLLGASFNPVPPLMCCGDAVLAFRFVAAGDGTAWATVFSAIAAVAAI